MNHISLVRKMCRVPVLYVVHLDDYFLSNIMVGLSSYIDIYRWLHLSRTNCHIEYSCINIYVKNRRAKICEIARKYLVMYCVYLNQVHAIFISDMLGWTIKSKENKM